MLSLKESLKILITSNQGNHFALLFGVWTVGLRDRDIGVLLTSKIKREDLVKDFLATLSLNGYPLSTGLRAQNH